ncbi:uncharacterized protein LOC108912277 [Anoplophora glabripennis]|uniref:uncharacterized protein LOC108912277 n=1 Tax=Anoplophora glabripennis TaxID=217634 RepID=UPI00087405AC|nr:uncharacterized protein LOC108912277 [Anoplophora glabripennis]
MASILVDKGADVTATDINGLNVLHYAVDSGTLENVKFALNLGLDVNCKDNKKWTPLLRAAILNISEDVINFLLENGADLNSIDTNGFDYKKHRFISSLYAKVETDGKWTYFKTATDDESPYSLVLHMSRAVKLGKMPLIRKIANNKPHLLETENKENKTPLVQAIESGDIQILQLLINLGASTNTPLFFNKRTPLMVAVYNGKLQMASILVDKGADVTATDINGLNVLHYAVDSGTLENVKFALNLGLDVNCKDNKKWTPLLRAGVTI